MMGVYGDAIPTALGDLKRNLAYTDIVDILLLSILYSNGVGSFDRLVGAAL